MQFELNLKKILRICVEKNHRIICFGYKLSDEAIMKR